MYSYTKNDYLILKTIAQKTKSAMLSITVKGIQKETNLSIVKIKNTLKLFIEDGFVINGIPKRTAKTYFMTEKGIKELKKICEGVNIND